MSVPSLTPQCALRSHITMGTTRYGGCRHGLLVEMGLRLSFSLFEVTAARLVGDAIEGVAWRVVDDV